MTIDMRLIRGSQLMLRLTSLIACSIAACSFAPASASAAWPRRAVTDDPPAWPRFQSFPADSTESNATADVPLGFSSRSPMGGQPAYGGLPSDAPAASAAPPVSRDSLAPTQPVIGGADVSPQFGPAPQMAPPPSCDSLTICPDDPVPHGSCLWRLLPDGMIPYIGPRTPDSRKDLGIGEPLIGKGWRAQPFSLSGFSGATNGGPLIRGHVFERPSYYGGMNFGWDYDHYWGIEKRLGFGALNLTNARGQRLQTGLSVTGEYRIMYYPLGDARWRPFFTTGLGWSDFYFQGDNNRHHLDTLLLFPFGVGVKYLWAERWAVRIDLIDELTFGNGPTSTFHYVALTAGLEFRYGKRLLHMPWHRRDGT